MPAVEGDWIARNFEFKSGERLAELRWHYTTLGVAARDAGGHVENAVLILHGSGGNGRGFLSAGLGGELFLKGQPLPSDGLHTKFPHSDDEDMVRAGYLLLDDGLGIDHLRLVMGTSTGAMHTGVGRAVSRVHGYLDAAGQRQGGNRGAEPAGGPDGRSRVVAGDASCPGV